MQVILVGITFFYYYMRLGLAAVCQPPILGFGECFYRVRHWMAMTPCCLLNAIGARISHLGMQAGVSVDVKSLFIDDLAVHVE